MELKSDLSQKLDFQLVPLNGSSTCLEPADLHLKMELQETPKIKLLKKLTEFRLFVQLIKQKCLKLHKNLALFFLFLSIARVTQPCLASATLLLSNVHPLQMSPLC